MRASLIGILIGLTFGIVVSGSGSQPEIAYGQTNSVAQSRGQQRVANPEIARSASSDVTAGGPLIALTTSAMDGQQNIVLIDPYQRTMGTYHVDGKTGKVSLRCVRDIHWDLQMDEFNGTEPSPEQIKALLRSR